MPKRVTVAKESSSGRNQRFHDNYNGNNMSRAEFVKQIKAGKYEDYHVRNINDVLTPVSNPDSTHRNNLG